MDARALQLDDAERAHLLGLGACWAGDRPGTALTADPGLTIAVYTAEPGTKSEEALDLLASWTATAATG